MSISIKRDDRGEAVCADCETHYFGDGDKAMVVDGELVCWNCLKKWAEDDFSGFMEYMTKEKRKILYDFDIEKLIEEDEVEEQEAIDAWFIETMRTRRYAD